MLANFRQDAFYFAINFNASRHCFFRTTRNRELTILSDRCTFSIGASQHFETVIHFAVGLDDINAVTLNTPSYCYAYKYAMIDGLLRLRAYATCARSNESALNGGNG